jgi:hypothetical protein
MATSREDRKKELLVAGRLLREALTIQTKTVVVGPNAVTKSFQLAKKIKAIGIKPWAFGGGTLALLLLKPWRFFTKKKTPQPLPSTKKEGLFSKLLRYTSTIMPLVQAVMGIGGLSNSSKQASPSSQIIAFLLEKIGNLLPKKNR